MSLPPRLHVQRVSNGVIVAGPSGETPRRVYVYTDGLSFGRAMTDWFDAFLPPDSESESVSDVTLVATEQLYAEPTASGGIPWSEGD